MSDDWIPVPGHVGRYVMNESGHIKTVARNVLRRNGRNQPITERTIKPILIHGYWIVTLYYSENKSRKQRVHRLLAKAFIPNPENKPQVNHINGIRSDNSIRNLEWATAKENTRHSVEIIKTFPRGETHHLAILTDEQIREIAKLGKQGFSSTEIARSFPVKPRLIRKICSGSYRRVSYAGI